MIPQSDIIEWSNTVAWRTNEHIEQDLVICRALLQIFNDDYLAGHLAFRGGTALHKLYLQPQPRYSEDIDLVQMKANSIGEVLDRLRIVLDFIGKAKVEVGDTMATMKFRFESEIAPVVPLRLKIEINCREHFAQLDWEKKDFSVQSNWFEGSCSLTTYKLEELLGTKIRALYQRRKGRDLYDLFQAFTKSKLNVEAILDCYRKYMKFSVENIPSQKEFIKNMELKLQDAYFVGDIVGLIRPDEVYDHNVAYKLVKKELFDKM
ncbi:MAG: nucleotidyl transferase AbiEii/AbiGii toxin family protein [Verrucomicrobia bacterium]|nr:nucleotidyl transferase AbiEii/AbiGii toxin family protein [Verrucomicrobiota bacterium]